MTCKSGWVLFMKCQQEIFVSLETRPSVFGVPTIIRADVYQPYWDFFIVCPGPKDK